jgi:protein TonB
MKYMRFVAVILSLAIGASAQGAAKWVKVPGAVMAGQILTQPEPVYPAEAKAAGLSGAVVLRVIVGKDGVVENLQILSGPDKLQNAAMDAVKGWTFKPYLVKGEAVQVDTTVTVNFTLPAH